MAKKSENSLKQQQKWQRQYEVLQAELQKALTEGPIMQGSAVVQRYKRQTKSGIKECGPYHLWTRKVQGKTVTVSLTTEQYRKIRQAVGIRRKVDKLIKRMQQISEQIILKSH